MFPCIFTGPKDSYFVSFCGEVWGNYTLFEKILTILTVGTYVYPKYDEGYVRVICYSSRIYMTLFRARKDEIFQVKHGAFISKLDDS